MKSVLLVVFIIINFFTGADMEIKDYFKNAETITININNESRKFKCDNEEFAYLISSIDILTKDSHEMPALGISLDSEIKEAMKNNVWIEFSYSTIQEHNEMPFDSLLIFVDKDSQGFNIFRGNNNKFEGRCFYINLNNSSMENLYNDIISLIN